MRQIFTVVLLLAPTALWSADWHVLTDQQITKALSSRVLHYDATTTQNFFADGRTVYRAGAGESWGKWWVSGNAYCSVWPPSDRQTCYEVAASGPDLRFTDGRGNVTVGRYPELE